MSKIPVVAIVAGLLPSLGIGAKGTLPWKLKQEMKYFRKVTTFTKCASKQNVVIMGRRTWESIPPKFRPLPNRLNIILTRSAATSSFGEGTLVASSLEDALSKLDTSGIEKIYIIGGAEIYNSLIDDERLTHVLLTEIKHTGDGELPEMDTFLKFDKDSGSWVENSDNELKEFIGDDSIEIAQVEEGDYKYNYKMWSRK